MAHFNKACVICLRDPTEVLDKRNISYRIYSVLLNSLVTNEDRGNLLGVAWFVWLEGPWIDLRYLDTRLIFDF